MIRSKRVLVVVVGAKNGEFKNNTSKLEEWKKIKLEIKQFKTKLADMNKQAELSIYCDSSSDSDDNTEDEEYNDTAPTVENSKL
jgi:23S rRNA A2030 N6-methylase RlmJ